MLAHEDLAASLVDLERRMGGLLGDHLAGNKLENFAGAPGRESPIVAQCGEGSAIDNCQTRPTEFPIEREFKGAFAIPDGSSPAIGRDRYLAMFRHAVIVPSQGIECKER